MDHKIKIFRRSGLPVTIEQMSLYENDWKIGFDEAKLKHGKEMLGLQEELAKLEQSLAQKYDVVALWDFLTDKKQIEDILTKYGDIRMALHATTNELVYIIEDME